jgi:hypothetical protein
MVVDNTLHIHPITPSTLMIIDIRSHNASTSTITVAGKAAKRILTELSAR